MKLLSFPCHSEPFQQELCLELKNHDAEKLPEEKKMEGKHVVVSKNLFIIMN